MQKAIKKHLFISVVTFLTFGWLVLLIMGVNGVLHRFEYWELNGFPQPESGPIGSFSHIQISGAYICLALIWLFVVLCIWFYYLLCKRIR